MSDAAAARDAISEVAGLIEAARRALADGRAVALASLEETTRLACRAVEDLPPEEGRRLRPALEAVLYDLDALTTDLTARYGDLVRRAEPTGRRPPTVGAAYRRADSLAAPARAPEKRGDESGEDR